MRFLVTGGAGFVGSHIAKALLVAGHSVRILDNLHTGSLKRLSDVLDILEFVKADIRDLNALDAAMHDCDGVFHEAALVAVQESYDMEQEYRDVNVGGTENVLSLAAEHGVRVVYASSSSVYGNAQFVPIHEDASKAPENPYGVTKADAETVALQYMVRDGAGVIGLRYFNVYGRGQTGSYAGVITQFMRRLEGGMPPVINGDGSQSRDFVHVSDVAFANLAAMTSHTRDGFFNVGTGRSITINELARAMIQAYSLDTSPEYADLPPGDVAASRADTSLATQSLPWTYSIGLEDGLAQLVGSTPS